MTSTDQLDLDRPNI